MDNGQRFEPIQCNISKREYFASKAPSDIPEWFKHKEPEKNIPHCIPWHQIEDEKDRELCREWVSDGFSDLPDHLVWFSDDFIAAKEAKELWELKNEEARYFQWRWYYADALLAALDYLTSKQNNEAVICLNCKSVYAKGIEMCPVCAGKTFHSTDQRNLTPKVSAPTQEQLHEEVRRLREALEGLMKGVEGLPPLTAIAGTLTKQYEAARTALQQTSKTENNDKG